MLVVLMLILYTCTGSTWLHLIQSKEWIIFKKPKEWLGQGSFVVSVLPGDWGQYKWYIFFSFLSQMVICCTQNCSKATASQTSRPVQMHDAWPRVKAATNVYYSIPLHLNHQFSWYGWLADEHSSIPPAPNTHPTASNHCCFVPGHLSQYIYNISYMK
jgi:hypothetical protein